MENQSNSLTEQFAIIDKMAEAWKSPVVARKKIGEFSGGILSAKTLANLDSRKEGPEGRFIVCNQIVYPTQSLVKFMKDRVADKWSRKAPMQRKKV